MTTKRVSWQLAEIGSPLRRIEDSPRPPGAGEVLIEVAGCGFCHTDMTFLSGEVTPKVGLPVVLGHEISGTVLEAGAGAEAWLGAGVVVPAVIPCGECAFCRAGRGNICQSQQMPGNDCDGGFSTHVTVPARGLSRVSPLPAGYELADFSVIADAVSTALQAVERAAVGDGDFVVVVGAGGVGGYAAQIAAARGARVVAVDVRAPVLDLLQQHCEVACIDATGLAPRDLRKRVRGVAVEAGVEASGWKIFECSGTVPGQESAFSLLVPAATLAIVGYTREPGKFRLSNLMAFDAQAFGTWGCPPERYADAIELVRSGKITLEPFIRRVPMSEIEQVVQESREGGHLQRPILIPPSGGHHAQPQ